MIEFNKKLNSKNISLFYFDLLVACRASVGNVGYIGFVQQKRALSTWETGFLACLIRGQNIGSWYCQTNPVKLKSLINGFLSMKTGSRWLTLGQAMIQNRCHECQNKPRSKHRASVWNIILISDFLWGCSRRWHRMCN